MRILFILLLLTTGYSTGQPGTPPAKEVKKIFFTGRTQGTTYHMTCFATDTLVTQKQIDSILNNIDSSLSIYKSYSLISRFNQADEGIEMDVHLMRVVRKSLEIYDDTKGISDISIYPLMKIWGFGPDHGTGNPDKQSILSSLSCVGSDKIHIRGNRLEKDLPCVKIDVNGIAQGYSVDVVANFFEKQKIKNYLVEIGGELRIHGRKQPGAEPMKIGIESPAANDLSPESLQQVIQVDEGAITTSGNYRNHHMTNGKIVSHLMDPKTGYPFQNELISVTVWAKDAITADGYDNALMGMGLKKAFLFLAKRSYLEAYFIYRRADAQVTDTATPGFYKFFVSKVKQKEARIVADKN